MRKTQALYFLSDKAYDHLITLAVQRKYRKPTVKTGTGISDFIHDLVTDDSIIWRDNRPDHIREFHEAAIKYRIAPEWKDAAHPRRVRCLRLYNETRVRILVLAYQFGILSEDPYIQGRSSIVNPNIAIGYVLEAIGLGWIVPSSLPIKGERGVTAKV